MGSERSRIDSLHHIEILIREVLRDFRIWELCDEGRFCRIADVHHVDVVHCLRRQFLVAREELESFALIGYNHQISSRQRQRRMGPGSSQFAAESRHEPQISQTLRACHILYVQDIETVSRSNPGKLLPSLTNGGPCIQPLSMKAGTCGAV